MIKSRVVMPGSCTSLDRDYPAGQQPGCCSLRSQPANRRHQQRPVGQKGQAAAQNMT